MGTPTTFDDLWPHLDPLPDEQLEQIYAAARTSTRFRLFLVAVFALFLAAIAALSLLVPVLYATTLPGQPTKFLLAVLVLAAIWGATQLTIRQVRQAYYRAILRELHRKEAQDVA